MIAVPLLHQLTFDILIYASVGNLEFWNMIIFCGNCSLTESVRIGKSDIFLTDNLESEIYSSYDNCSFAASTNIWHSDLCFSWQPRIKNTSSFHARSFFESISSTLWFILKLTTLNLNSTFLYYDYCFWLNQITIDILIYA